ncbi:MAG: glycosyltransferase family 2 protein [Plesiomonas sp.]|uniref:glycosyltransferase family 2 protein n=1 Tax=Plesiomonas sp. TaxID=2486279 RepID=UPI003F34DB5B
MEKPLLSIIIAAHNTAEYIDICLKSLDDALNGYTASRLIEAIIVNDCSTDDTLKKINDYKEIRFIKKVFSVNYTNVGKVKKFAFNQCTGEYITVLDSDDALRHDSLVSVLNIIEKEKYDIFISPIIEKHGEFIIDSIAQHDKGEILNTQQACELFLSHKKIEGHIAGKLIKSANLSEKDFIDLPCYEDIITVGHALKNSNRVFFSHTPFYLYRKRTGSTSDDKSGNKILLLFSALEILENIFSDNKAFKNMIDALWVKSISDLVSRGNKKTKIAEKAKNKIASINSLPFILDPKIRLSRKKMLIKLKVKTAL